MEHYIVNGEIHADFYRVLCEVFASFDQVSAPLLLVLHYLREEINCIIYNW